MKSYKLLEQTLFTEVKQISLLYVAKTYAKPISASSIVIHPNFKVHSFYRSLTWKEKLIPLKGAIYIMLNLHLVFVTLEAYHLK